MTVKAWHSYSLDGLPVENYKLLPPDVHNYGQKVATVVAVPQDQLNGEYVLRFHQQQPSQESIDAGYAKARPYYFVAVKRSTMYITQDSLLYKVYDPYAQIYPGDTGILYFSSAFDAMLVGIPRPPSTVPNRPSIIDR